MDGVTRLTGAVDAQGLAGGLSPWAAWFGQKMCSRSNRVTDRVVPYPTSSVSLGDPCAGKADLEKKELGDCYFGFQ